METTKRKSVLTKEQIKMLKNSARKLQLALENSDDPLAFEFLDGELGETLNTVLTRDVVSTLDEIPNFELMTRDCLPDIADLYFDFYSLAKYGKPAIENR